MRGDLTLFTGGLRGVAGERLDIFIHAAVGEHLLKSGPLLSAGDTAANHLVLALLEFMVRQDRL